MILFFKMKSVIQRILKHSRPTKNLVAPLKNERGVALLLAIFAATMMMVLAVDLVYETTVDYQVGSQQIQRLKTYYAAKGAMELALLKIKVYQTAVASIGSNAQVATVARPLLDMMLQKPETWPPLAGPNTSSFDQDSLKDSIKESLMDAQYVATISQESGKIDLNDLASPSQGLARSVRNQLLNTFNQRLANDDEFRKKYQYFRFPELLNNIQDWVDEDSVGLNGGDERSQYPELHSEIRTIPPNQPFRTIEELHIVAKMTDDMFDFLTEISSIYGPKGINVNYATDAQLQNLHPQMRPEIVRDILERRNNPRIGPFPDMAGFLQYIQAKGLNPQILDPTQNQNAIPLYFDPEFIFKVRATGTFGRTSREIIAIVYDFGTLKNNLQTSLKNSPTCCKR